MGTPGPLGEVAPWKKKVMSINKLLIYVALTMICRWIKWEGYGSCIEK
jgi:hypothetical protein